VTVVKILMIADCSDSEAGVYKLTVGQEQEMTLTAMVYNGGEEAHQAVLSVVLPPHLDYIGTGTKVCPSISCCRWTRMGPYRSVGLPHGLPHRSVRLPHLHCAVHRGKYSVQ